MTSSRLQRLLSFVPERRVRASSGTTFDASAQSAQIRHLSKLLHWLSPLSLLEPQDQVALGLLGLRNKMAEPDEEELDDNRKRRLPPGNAPSFAGLDPEKRLQLGPDVLNVDD